MTGRRRSLWLATAGLLVVLLGAGGWVLATDVGAPEGAFAHTPEPCDLLPEATLQALVPGATSRSSVPFGEPSWRPLHRGAETKRCDWTRTDGEDDAIGELRIDVERYHGTQFGLGRSGAERAADATASRDGCGVPLPVEGAEACISSRDPVDLVVRHHNVTVRVFFARYTGAVAPEPEELARHLAGEVASALSRAADGPSAAVGSVHPPGLASPG